jgi:hypothetical protein
MFRSIAVLAASLAVCLLTAAPSSAEPMNFYFSFSNSTANGCGNCNIPGTVTGEIFGLENNSTTAATNVEVFSYPGGILNVPSAPFSVSDYAASLGQFVNANFFTVTDGQITDARYQIFGGYFDIDVNNEFNTLTGFDAGTRVQNLLGLSGITFTYVPEPLTVSLFGAGLAGMAALRRRKKARQA